MVHLVRAANGIGPLQAFVDSYDLHPAGVAHELLLLFKGFEKLLPAEYEQLLKGVAHVRHFVPDQGFDVDAYFEVAREHQADVLCFLNSFSVILADGWLDKLHCALVANDAGMVGATGSWQSVSSNYADAHPEPLALDARRPAWKRRLIRWFPFLRKIVPALRWFLLRGMFDRFPNDHLRTNAFMLRRETALGVRIAPIRRKFDAYRFESGRDCLTRQVLQTGKAVLVVGRDGKAFGARQWHLSNTFWRRAQENLLVADNQTRAYEDSDADGRAMYSALAWGPEADPGRA